MASVDVAYAAVVLTIYILLVVPAAYTTYKHGVPGMAWLGWAYFMIFCSLRIVGSALQIADSGSTGAAIISSVGLSPLIIAIGGVLHEARFYLLSLRNNTEKDKMDKIFVIFFHMIIAAAIALLAVGASGLQSTGDQADPSRINRDWHLAGVGGLILLSVITLIFLGAVYTYVCHKPRNTQQRLAQKLVVAVAVACPLIAIRVIGSTVFYFSRNLDMNPVNGTWGFRVGLYLVPELLAACALLAGGLAARNVREETSVVSESGHKLGSRGS